MKMFKLLLLSTLVFGLNSCFVEEKQDVNAEESKGEINIYTDRHYDIDKELYDAFTKETGISVNVVDGKAQELLERIDKEGANSVADLYFTSDVGRLTQAENAGYFQNSNSAILANNIPAHLRDEDGKWYGLTKRARIIVYSKERVNPESLSTYEALANPEFKGEIAVRSASNVYNQSLMASVIASCGEKDAQTWAEGIVANMYQDPAGNDRDQVKAVYAGKADIAIVNTYYLGKLLNSKDELERKAGESVAVFYPNQEGRGAHINISGAGIIKTAPNKENAIKLLEFLSSKQAQGKFAEANYEFPVNKEVEASALVKSWGDFKEDEIALSKIGELNTAAIKVFDKANWK